ncbi:MAG: riboflavin kinase [Brevinemataceae bacterium]
MIYNEIDSLPLSDTLHIAIGSFDGLHYAHQHIISLAKEQAKQNNEKSLILTFEPIPKEFFLKQNFHGRLIPPNIKQEMLTKFNTDYVVITNFSEIKNYSEEEFILKLLTKAKRLILYSGPDFRIGSAENNKNYTGNNVSFIKIEDIYINDDICRSTNIRKLISEGQIVRANNLLGWEYKLYSVTTPGDKIGRTINFPTINMEIPDQLLPQYGVYFGETVIFNKTYPSAIYIGTRPTIHGSTLRIESHIIEEFPYPEITTGTLVEMIFIKKISEEKTFGSLENLQEVLYNYKKISSGLATERYKNKTDRHNDRLSAEEL